MTKHLPHEADKAVVKEVYNILCQLGEEYGTRLTSADGLVRSEL